MDGRETKEAKKNCLFHLCYDLLLFLVSKIESVFCACFQTHNSCIHSIINLYSKEQCER